MELLCQFSPLIGHLSSSLTSQIGSQLAVSSRYDVNVFSYESDWSIGACWWLRKGFRSDDGSGRAMEGQPQPVVGSREREAGVLKMRASTAGEVSLLYVSRISNVLFSIGVLSDFKSLTRPVKSLGAEVSFFS
jgi:distribution and morphology protein 10